MVVLVLDTAFEKLRGMLSQWFLELKPGVFVGRVKKPVREYVWFLIEDSCMHSGAIMVWTSDTDQGFDMKVVGVPYRCVVDFDGLKLVARV